MREFNYIALQSGGYYGEAAQRHDWVNAGQSMVIEYQQFIKFMNDGVVTQPIFVTDEYSLAIDMAKQLNESAFAAQNGILQDEQK
jgi:hypothetical protein